MTKKETLLKFIADNIIKGSRMDCQQRQITTNEQYNYSYFFINIESGINYFKANFNDDLISTTADIEILEYSATQPID